jgi:hypothetical protein
LKIAGFQIEDVSDIMHHNGKHSVIIKNYAMDDFHRIKE